MNRQSSSQRLARKKQKRQKRHQKVDSYAAKRSQLTVAQYFNAIELSRSHRQEYSNNTYRLQSSQHQNESLHESPPSERVGKISISISNRCFRLFVISMSISILSIATINMLLPSYTSNNAASRGENPQNVKSRWTQRKISSAKAHVIQADGQQIFRNRNLFVNKFDDENTALRSSRKVESYINEQFKKSSLIDNKKHTQLYGAMHVPEMADWPPISTLIDNDGNIRDEVDASGFLDFAIVGFAKAGTTSVLRHLSDITNSLSKEHCDLVINDSGQLLMDLYEDHASRLKKSKRSGEELEDRLRGLKCPQDLSSDNSIINYAKYFPGTKLIIGIRHPVLWFESLYNFRVANVPWKAMLPTRDLVRGCISGSQGVCAWRASFHDFMSRLGKTPMTSSSEKELLQLGLSRVKSKVGEVFLYEVSQLSESDNDGGARSDQFRKDLKEFLGLQEDILPFPIVDTSGRFDFLPIVKRQVDRNKIDICQPEHDIIRAVLMEKAVLASEWIRKYFLQSNEVFVSSREHFELILESWMYDPCIIR